MDSNKRKHWKSIAHGSAETNELKNPIKQIALGHPEMLITDATS